MLRTITKVTRETPRESGKREGKGSESYILEQEWLKAQRPGRYQADVAENTDRCKTQSTKQSEELPRLRG